MMNKCRSTNTHHRHTAQGHRIPEEDEDEQII